MRLPVTCLLVVFVLLNKDIAVNGQNFRRRVIQFLRNRESSRPTSTRLPRIVSHGAHAIGGQAPSPHVTAHLQPLSPTDLAAMRAEFAQLFRQSDTKITRYVQMGFHICVGGCDGCLNLNDVSNIGLVTHYDELRRMYTRWQNVVSLADYAVISAYEALRAGVEKDSNRCNIVSRCKVDIPFTAGRITCPDPGNPPTSVRFPKGEDTSTPTRDVKEAFGLSTFETVALMGCHSLGGSHTNQSGFEGIWDLTPTLLDNGYFQALEEMTWRQKFMSDAKSNQWVGTTNTGRELMMLHADMILKHRFTVGGDEHRASCSSTSRCPGAGSTATAISRFSSDNKLFITTLGQAFTKMCNTANFDSRLRREFE